MSKEGELEALLNTGKWSDTETEFPLPLPQGSIISMMNTRYSLTTPDITDIIVDSRILIQYLKGVFFGSAKPVTLGEKALEGH